MPDEVKPSLEAPPKETPAAKEEAPPKEAPKEEKKDDFNPAPDHPRFKEVYWKQKKAERDLEETRKDMEALRAHNAQIAASMEELKRVQTSKPDEPEPDIVTDPDGYKAWARLREHKKEKEHQERLAQERIGTQIEIESGLHDDYHQAIALTEREMAIDPALKKKIWAEGNPARAAYKYGRKKMDEAAAKDKDEAAAKDKDEVERQERLDAGRVEGAAPPAPPPPKEEDLSDDEKRVVRALFRDMDPKEAMKKYKEQKKLLAARG